MVPRHHKTARLGWDPQRDDGWPLLRNHETVFRREV
jgi:hypothetical protein